MWKIEGIKRKIHKWEERKKKARKIWNQINICRDKGKIEKWKKLMNATKEKKNSK